MDDFGTDLCLTYAELLQAEPALSGWHLTELWWISTSTYGAFDPMLSDTVDC